MAVNRSFIMIAYGALSRHLCVREDIGVGSVEGQSNNVYMLQSCLGF